MKNYKIVVAGTGNGDTIGLTKKNWVHKDGMARMKNPRDLFMVMDMDMSR